MQTVTQSQAAATEIQVADQCYIQAIFVAGMADTIPHSDSS